MIEFESNLRSVDTCFKRHDETQQIKTISKTTSTFIHSQEQTKVNMQPPSCNYMNPLLITLKWLGYCTIQAIHKESQYLQECTVQSVEEEEHSSSRETSLDFTRLLRISWNILWKHTYSLRNNFPAEWTMSQEIMLRAVRTQAEVSTR